MENYCLFITLLIKKIPNFNDKANPVDFIKFCLSSPEVCSEHSGEDNLETVVNNLPTKEFVIPQGTKTIISTY